MSPAGASGNVDVEIVRRYARIFHTSSSSRARRAGIISVPRDAVPDGVEQTLVGSARGPDSGDVGPPNAGAVDTMAVRAVDAKEAQPGTDGLGVAFPMGWRPGCPEPPARRPPPRRAMQSSTESASTSRFPSSRPVVEIVQNIAEPADNAHGFRSVFEEVGGRGRKMRAGGSAVLTFLCHWGPAVIIRTSS